MLRAVLLGFGCFAVAHAGGRPAVPAPAVASGKVPIGSSSGSCRVTLTIDESVAKLDVNGALNGYTIELDKKETARPAGDVVVELSIPCPKTDLDLLEPFTFTMHSVGSLLILPQVDLTVAAAKVVKIEVDGLQIELHTPSPVTVMDTSFETPNGLEMSVTKGTATALRHSFELVGFSAQVPFNGYFTYLEITKELTLHVTDFDSNFRVSSEEPKIEGNFEVTGWITLLGSTAGKLVTEHVRARALGLGATQGRDAHATAIMAFAVVGAVGALVVAAAAARRRRAAESLRGASRLPVASDEAA